VGPSGTGDLASARERHAGPLSGGTTAAAGVATLGVITVDAGWQVLRHLTVMARCAA